MSLQGHYQNAYVTHDLESAMKLMARSFGLGAFSAFEVDMLSATPSGERSSQLKVATAWAGALQVELIQPVSGFLDPYLAALPEDPTDAVPRLHHIAVRREDPIAMRKEALGLDLPLAFESDGAGISCVFVDARSRMGHFLEFVSATEDGWALVGWPRDAATVQSR